MNAFNLSSDFKSAVSATTAIDCEECTFTWSIKRFDEITWMTSAYIKSPVFKVNAGSQYPWMLIFQSDMLPYDDQDNWIPLREQSGYFRLALCSLRKTETKATFKIGLVDSTGGLQALDTYEYDFYGDKFTLIEFIKIEELLAMKTQLFPRGTLKIKCYVKYFTKMNNSPLCKLPSKSKSFGRFNIHGYEAASLKVNFLAFVKEVPKDVTLIVDGKKIEAHKIILSARSPVFEKIFQVDMKEEGTNTYNVKDVKLDVMKLLVRFLYAVSIKEELTPEITGELYSAARLYQVTDLENFCSDYIGNNLTADNVCKFFEMAVLHHDDALKSITKKFMLLNASLVFSSTEWERVSKACPYESSKVVQDFTKENIKERKSYYNLPYNSIKFKPPPEYWDPEYWDPKY